MHLRVLSRSRCPLRTTTVWKRVRYYHTNGLDGLYDLIQAS